MDPRIEKLWDEVLEEFKDAIEKGKQPTTVEELDEQTHFPHPDEDEVEVEREPQVILPKWKVAELRILDVINNTLEGQGTVTLERATILRTLAETREIILRYRT